MITSTIHGTPVLYSDLQLHGTYFSTPTSPQKVAILLSPLFEEKRCAHRAMITVASALAQAGVAAFLPDLYGTGNSCGYLTEMALDRWFDDLYAARDYAHDRAANAEIVLVAGRAGALLAANAVAEGLSINQLVLWQPVVAGRGYLNQLRTRRMIQDKMTGEAPPPTGEYEVEGQCLSPALFTAFQQLRLPAEMPALPITLVQCSFNDKLLTEYARLLTQWEGNLAQTRTIICEPFWHPHSPGEYQQFSQAIVAEALT